MYLHRLNLPCSFMCPNRLCFPFLLAALYLTFVSAQAQTPQASLIPEGSAMAACKPEMPRILLNPCEDGGALLTSGMYGRQRMMGASVEVYHGLEPKIGRDVLKFKSDTFPSGNGRADFILSKSPPGHIQYLGAWIYLAADSNVFQLGFQVEDTKGEKFESEVAANWKGWKWIEFNLQDPAFKPVDPKNSKNKIDFPLQNIHFVWNTQKSGANFMGLDGLAAVLQSYPGDKPYTIEVSGSNDGEANASFNGQAVVNNFSDKPVDVDVTYSIQTNPLLYDLPLIDPAYGDDRALNCKTWIEVDGKRIEDKSLTDGESGSYFSTTNFVPGGGMEGFQFLDLGQERKIIRIDYWGGDAKWLHKVDFSASPDGKNYTPVEGLQEIDIANKFGGPNTIRILNSFNARYLRLRYHNDGNKLNGNDPKNKDSIAFYTLSKLTVYDGLHPEELEIPKVGEIVEQKIVHITAPPHNFALQSLPISVPLKTGSYYFGAVIKGPSRPQFYSNDYFARSAEEIKTRPESRFGMDAAVPGYASELKRMGIGWVRFENMKWVFFNKVPNQFNYERDDIPLDTGMNDYHNAGLSILPYIFITPNWFSSAPADTKNKGVYPPKDNDDYGKAIFETVARYGFTKHPDADLHTNDKKSGLGWIKAYELWNEPNLNNPNWGTWAAPIEKYLDLFRVGAEALKRADPNSKASTAGLSGLGMKLIDKFRTYKYPDGKTALDFADILNVHFYSRKQEPEWTTADQNINSNAPPSNEVVTYEKQLINIADWRDTYKPSMPIWMTETGINVGGPMGCTERLQAAKIPRSLMLCLANGIEKVFLYREVGSTPAMHAGSGIIREDNTLRPSYFTMATLTRQLDSVTDLRTPRLQTSNPKVWMYNWNRGKDHVLTAWTPQDTQPLGLDLGKCHVVDSFGTESDMEVDKKFQLSIFPVYITQITNTTPVEQLEKEAAAREDLRKKEFAFLLNKAHLYLYDFGSHQNAATLTLALPRAVVPVEAADTYTAKNGYGFLGKDGKNEWEKMEGRNPMENGSVYFTAPDGFQFQVDAAPGVYNLELKGTHVGKDAKLTINGSKEGDISIPLDADNLTKAQVTVTAGHPLQLKVTENVGIQWLTLVETPPQMP